MVNSLLLKQIFLPLIRTKVMPNQVNYVVNGVGEGGRELLMKKGRWKETGVKTIHHEVN